MLYTSYKYKVINQKTSMLFWDQKFKYISKSNDETKYLKVW